jgi:hypothetical protein
MVYLSSAFALVLVLSTHLTVEIELFTIEYARRKKKLEWGEL